MLGPLGCPLEKALAHVADDIESLTDRGITGRVCAQHGFAQRIDVVDRRVDGNLDIVELGIDGIASVIDFEPLRIGVHGIAGQKSFIDVHHCPAKSFIASMRSDI